MDYNLANGIDSIGRFWYNILDKTRIEEVFMTQSKKMFNLFTVSEARGVLFGIATLWIGLFHSD